MVYLYDACDQISDFCHQQLLRKMRRKISWTDGRKDRRTEGWTEVKQYTPLPEGITIMWFNYKYDSVFTCAHVSLSWVVKTATWLHSSDSEKYTDLFSNNSDFKDINRKYMLTSTVTKTFFRIQVWFGLWYLRPLSIIFQLYHGSQLY